MTTPLEDAEKYMADLQILLRSTRKNFKDTEERLLNLIWETSRLILYIREENKRD